MDTALSGFIQFQLQSLRYKVGYAGLVGILLLLIGGATFFALVLPKSHALAAKKIEIANIQALADSSSLIATQSSYVLDANMPESLLQTLPKATKRDAALSAIITLADQNALPLDSGKYETLVKETTDLLILQVSFPLKGTYPQIKHFLADTLNSLPNAAIVQLGMRRDSIQTNQLNADVVLRLYFAKEF